MQAADHAEKAKAAIEEAQSYRGPELPSRVLFWVVCPSLEIMRFTSATTSSVSKGLTRYAVFAA